MIKPPPIYGTISSKWEYDMQGDLTCMHFTDPPDGSLGEGKDLMIRHCFLEVLDLLEIIKYSRGYDGIYYDVTLKRVKR